MGLKKLKQGEVIFKKTDVREWLDNVIKVEVERIERTDYWNDDKQEGYIAALRAVRKEFT